MLIEVTFLKHFALEVWVRICIERLNVRPIFYFVTRRFILTVKVCVQ